MSESASSMIVTEKKRVLCFMFSWFSSLDVDGSEAESVLVNCAEAAAAPESYSGCP